MPRIHIHSLSNLEFILNGNLEIAQDYSEDNKLLEKAAQGNANA